MNTEQTSPVSWSLEVSSLGRADFPPTWQQRARVLLDYQQHVLNLSQLFPVSCHGHCYQKIWLLLQEDLGTQIQKRNSAFISLTTCWICSCCCCFLCLHWRFTISNHNKFALFSLNQAALSNNVQDVRVPGIQLDAFSCIWIKVKQNAKLISRNVSAKKVSHSPFK